MSATPRRVALWLIRPTKYDDDGYLLRHWRGMLPSNSLAALRTLTHAALADPALANCSVRVAAIDESVQAVPLRRIARAARRRDTRAIVCLVGVQTSQFPRATALALQLRAAGVVVLVGGFHVSGTLAFTRTLPPHLQALVDAGVTLVSGEVEGTWPRILGDAVAGRLAPRYDAPPTNPDLAEAPLPALEPAHLRRFAFQRFATLDSGRGCPFTCSFCTIINVQGQRMRARDPQAIAAAIAAGFRTTGTSHYFFTDDNFARSARWRELLQALAELREARGVPLRFLMQVDTVAHRLPEFVELARRAGCFQVFIGVESLNAANLAGASKRQNRVGGYADMVAAWREAGILTHFGYIVGFPHDTPDSVRDDIAAMQATVRPDLAAFFMLTPLPGSRDFEDLRRAGTPLDDDLNRYDTFHPVVDHPRMSRAEWFAAYRGAWRQFYTPAYMRDRLVARRGAQHLSLLQMYAWYTTAAFVEDYHPMMTGFLRLKPRTDRRPGCIPDGRLRHLRRRLPEVATQFAGYAARLRELQALWAATHDGVRPPARLGEWVAFLRTMAGPDAAPPALTAPDATAPPSPSPAIAAIRSTAAWMASSRSRSSSAHGGDAT